MLERRQDELGTPLFQNAFHSAREIKDEVESISDLLTFRRTQRGSLGIEAAAIAGDCGDFRMRFEPFRKALRSSVREKIEHAVQIQVDQNRSVFLPFAPGPVIDAQVAHRRTDVRYGSVADSAENGIVAGAQGKPLEESLSRASAGNVPDNPYNLAGSIRLSGVRACNAGQPFAEDFTRARRIAAAKASYGSP